MYFIAFELGCGASVDKVHNNGNVWSSTTVKLSDTSPPLNVLLTPTE